MDVKKEPAAGVAITSIDAVAADCAHYATFYPKHLAEVVAAPVPSAYATRSQTRSAKESSKQNAPSTVGVPTTGSIAGGIDSDIVDINGVVVVMGTNGASGGRARASDDEHRHGQILTCGRA